MSIPSGGLPPERRSAGNDGRHLHSQGRPGPGQRFGGPDRRLPVLRPPGPDAALLVPIARARPRRGSRPGSGSTAAPSAAIRRSRSRTCSWSPTPNAAYMDPFTKVPTIVLHCFVKDPVTGEMYSRDPRGIARRPSCTSSRPASPRLSYWGPESEFYIFDSIRFDQNAHEGYYHIDSEAGAWNSGREEDGRQPRLQAPAQGGLLPRPSHGPLPGPAHRHGAQPAEAGHRRRGPPPRGRHRRTVRDRHPLRDRCWPPPTTS